MSITHYDEIRTWTQERKERAREMFNAPSADVSDLCTTLIQAANKETHRRILVYTPSRTRTVTCLLWSFWR